MVLVPPKSPPFSGGPTAATHLPQVPIYLPWIHGPNACTGRGPRDLLVSPSDAPCDKQSQEGKARGSDKVPGSLVVKGHDWSAPWVTSQAPRGSSSQVDKHRPGSPCTLPLLTLSMPRAEWVVGWAQCTLSPEHTVQSGAFAVRFMVTS